MPAGVLVIVPRPEPTLVTVNWKTVRVNVAVTDLAPSIVTTHAPVPEHAPLQPAKTDAESGVAVRVTCVPAS